MTESIIMRTTDEQSGEYRVYAAAEVGGETPIKGLALHQDIVEAVVGDIDYIEAEVEEGGNVSLDPDKATSATVRVANLPAVRHAYLSPEFLSQFDEGFEFEGEETDLDAVPSVGLASIESSSEDAYESDKEDRSSAEDAAEALVGGSDGESAEDSDESDESEDEEVDIAPEELGIAE